ncbi:SatD family protein [Aeromicrobium sp.]|uniref:SatD family protein n=1 Tax=Aeromicrobium sp. TaxID=1871063 RepID=UPI003C6A8442
MSAPHPHVAVIADLVGSRTQPDRAAAQYNLVAALAQVNRSVDAVQPLAPTIGDECQGVYADVPSALRATLLLRLTLEDPLDCRFGVGLGTYRDVGRSDYGPMQDGPAWWAARDAIVETKARESRKHRSLRTWYVVSDDMLHGSQQFPEPAAINAYLLARDEIVSGMNARSRRLLLGLLDERTQVELAKIEDITQSAVSQNLQRSGAYAVLGGVSLLQKASQA